MNRKGGMVLRNVIFIVIIFSGIMALSSIFVSEMSFSYNNTNMSSSYNQDLIGKDQLSKTTSTWQDIAEKLQGNLFEMLLGTLKAAGQVLKEVLFAPATFSSILASVLKSFGVSGSITKILGFILAASLYVLIIFVIISSFLKGGKM